MPERPSPGRDPGARQRLQFRSAKNVSADTRNRHRLQEQPRPGATNELPSPKQRGDSISPRRGRSHGVSRPRTVRAELIGSHSCTADGLTASGNAPALALCRALLAAGVDPACPLWAYRGAILCLKVRSLGEGAELAVEDGRHGTPRFRRWRKRDEGYGAGSPIRQIGVVDTAGALVRDGRRGGR
jgi:hypothetical protein